jgi:hypothetical protein
MGFYRTGEKFLREKTIVSRQYETKKKEAASGEGRRFELR